jgi:hypothetical protein
MIARVRRRWQDVLEHPMLRLELRRIRRTRWWPGRRFFLFYPVLLGCAAGYGVALLLADSLMTQLSISVTALPVVCLFSAASSLLSTLLPWIAPALTASTIVRERELGTLDLLRTTLLAERSIVLGKLGGCLVRLWPAILTLALLTPFQLVVVAWGGLVSSPGLAGILSMDPIATDVDWPWGWLVLASFVGLLRPWAHLALHGAVGVFASVVARSTGVAIALSYGAILVFRAGLWMLVSVVGPLLLLVRGGMAIDPVGSTEMGRTAMLLGSVLPPLVSVCIESAGAALLVWAAIWWLKRM